MKLYIVLLEPIWEEKDCARGTVWGVFFQQEEAVQRVKRAIGEFDVGNEFEVPVIYETEADQLDDYNDLNCPFLKVVWRYDSEQTNH